MSIDQVIALSASIGGCMSAIAALLAVKQSTKQREASYKPELAITRTPIIASKNSLTGGTFADFWVVEKQEKKLENEDLLSFFSLPIRNVGLGAAKEVTLKWSFPIEELVSNINKMAQKSLIPAYFEYENEVLSLVSEQLVAATSMWGGQKQVTLDYVLPASTDREGVNICIPPAYIELVSALLYFSAKDKDLYHLPSMPVLNLDLEYFDIGGDIHKSSLKIELNLGAIYGEGEGFIGYMQSKKFA